MKKHLKFRSLVSLGLALSLLISFSACEKEPTDERPELPPIESLVMDFSDFSEQPGGIKGSEVTYENFLHSYISVVFWNIASTATVALPATAYGVALLQIPEYLGDNTWEWKFDFPLNDQNYTATLTAARINNEEFSMEMVIGHSLVPNLGVKWFDGEIRYDHTHATWNLYKEGIVNVLEAEWNMDFETNATDLTYTYVEPGQEETGSFIMLEYIPEADYDAAYTISLATNVTNIEWNSSSTMGRVMDIARFEDSEWHCWDTQANGHIDKVCE